MITLLSILLLGFFLGMRHATDADHVVAITNIVSQQRSVRSAAWTGIFWGIGHSLTMLVVGGAIVAFGMAVSRRLGLGLELSVACSCASQRLLAAVSGRISERQHPWIAFVHAPFALQPQGQRYRFNRQMSARINAMALSKIGSSAGQRDCFAAGGGAGKSATTGGSGACARGAAE